MESSGRVAILLATYNGERYVDEQIRSLFAQTYSDFVIIVRDDHSSDRTPEILARWSASQPDKISVVSDDRGNLRSAGNFSRLMEVCDSPYFAFCDQDDVWLPNKVELMVNEIRRLESQFGKTMPILVHSDLKVVDGDLHEIAPSFFYYHLRTGLRKGRRLDHLIFINIVTGCALMGNRALLELARPLPAGILVHDWWLALIAASCGVLRTIPETTVLYRQHGNNQIGAGPRHGRSLWRARHILRQPRKLKARLAAAIATVQSQAHILLRVAGGKMSRRDREFLGAFCLPRRRDEVAGLPWAQRTLLFARFLIAYARALPIALQWCY
jgi:glycosyltransferase involved in cell wall biosynthesis